MFIFFLLTFAMVKSGIAERLAYQTQFGSKTARFALGLTSLSLLIRFLVGVPLIRYTPPCLATLVLLGYDQLSPDVVVQLTVAKFFSLLCLKMTTYCPHTLGVSSANHEVVAAMRC